MRSKHLQKQLAEQQKGLQSLEKEAVKLQRDLAKEEAAVQSCCSRCLLRWTLGLFCHLLQQNVIFANSCAWNTSATGTAGSCYESHLLICSLLTCHLSLHQHCIGHLRQRGMVSLVGLTKSHAAVCQLASKHIQSKASVTLRKLGCKATLNSCFVVLQAG